MPLLSGYGRFLWQWKVFREKGARCCHFGVSSTFSIKSKFTISWHDSRQAKWAAGSKEPRPQVRLPIRAATYRSWLCAQPACALSTQQNSGPHGDVGHTAAGDPFKWPPNLSCVGSTSSVRKRHRPTQVLFFQNYGEDLTLLLCENFAKCKVKWYLSYWSIFLKQMN